MRIAGLIGLMIVAVPAAANAGTNDHEPDPALRRDSVCNRPTPPTAQRQDTPESRRTRPLERPDCRPAPSYPAVVDPTPVFIL